MLRPVSFVNVIVLRLFLEIDFIAYVYITYIVVKDLDHLSLSVSIFSLRCKIFKAAVLSLQFRGAFLRGNVR